MSPLSQNMSGALVPEESEDETHQEEQLVARFTRTKKKFDIGRGAPFSSVNQMSDFLEKWRE